MAYSSFSVQEVANLFDIDDVSACELLDGTIDFEVGEIHALALYKSMLVSELVGMMQD